MLKQTEPTIGYIKADSQLGRNWIKGALGNAMHAMLYGAGHHIRLVIGNLKSYPQMVPV